MKMGMRMASPISLCIISFLFLFFKSSSAMFASYNVMDFGARPDGMTDSTQAFLGAWYAACSSWMPATMYVPPGRFLLYKQAEFVGPCKNKAIMVRIDGAIVAPADYNVFQNYYYWILFVGVEGVSVHGGVLDGQGASLWACKASGNECPNGVTTVEFSNSKNIVITGLTSVNSQMFHIVFHGCNNVKLDNLKVVASGNSPNTDGIHVAHSSGFQILNSMISTGDDCISIGPGTTNLLVHNVLCSPGHGISIGSLGRDFQEAGVENVTVNTVAFVGTQNGVRIKTWGKPSTSFVKRVKFQHAKMINVQNPIIIDQNYCPSNKNCPGLVSGVKISDVTYTDIYGSSATEVAVKFDCSRKNPCSGIILEDVKLRYNNQSPKALCANAAAATRGYVEPTLICFRAPKI